jgi:hypothetical protein
MRPGGLSVQEIALVSRPKRVSGRVHPPAPPRPKRPPAIPGYFLDKRDYADTYSLVLLRAGGSLGITPAGAAYYRLLRGTTASVLMQLPRRR